MTLYDNITEEVIGEYNFSNLFFGKRFILNGVEYKVYGIKVERKIMGVYVVKA